uniref:Torsin a n=1 Tax=Riptortus pedestris TaxID=329032 RepID=R4WRR5_RIPPE|nr:torsin a [Riptortus pedestris]
MKWTFYIYCHFLTINTALSWEWFDSVMDSITGERCINRWMPNDVKGLKNDFNKEVFGQPFLERALIPLLKHHLGVDMPEDYVPRKALALSFHGSPGVGKTYVSQLIARHLFKDGEKSKFYKMISLGKSMEMTETHLRELVISTVWECDRAVFVFDEIEKMADGTFEILKSFLDFHKSVDKVDYRKSIFIFISNIGEDRINSLALSYWKKGINREDYPLLEFSKVLEAAIYNENSGLKKTKIVKNYLIDLYLPFLPLEKRHVEKCIAVEAHMSKVHLTPNSVKTIIDSIEFLPAEEQIYSPKGCKNLASLVKIHGRNEL